MQGRGFSPVELGKTAELPSISNYSGNVRGTDPKTKKGRDILRCHALETVSYSRPASPPNLLVRVPAEALALSFNPAAGAVLLCDSSFSQNSLPAPASSPSSNCATKFLGSVAHLGRRRFHQIVPRFPSIVPGNFHSPFQSGDTINFLSFHVNANFTVRLCKSVHACENSPRIIQRQRCIASVREGGTSRVPLRTASRN
jgi:hypothetical protein